MKMSLLSTLAMSLVWILSVSFANPVSSSNLSNEEDIAIVSWYGGKFHGRLTASGEVYNMYDLTAANKKLPFGTKVRITNLNNEKSVVVRINGRGPYVGNRKFDLSKAAFSEIASLDRGTLRVKYEILKQ